MKIQLYFLQKFRKVHVLIVLDFSHLTIFIPTKVFHRLSSTEHKAQN